PLLGLLQNQGRRVALVTDGRLSGASGKIPAAIHVTPEAARGGPIARIREGDIVRLDGEGGTLEVLVDATEWAARGIAANTAPAAWPAPRARPPRPSTSPPTPRAAVPSPASARATSSAWTARPARWKCWSTPPNGRRAASPPTPRRPATT